MATLLDAFTRRNVGVNSDATALGPNTLVNTNIHPTNWREWEGFNYDALTQIFRLQLSQEYRGEQQPRPLLNDLCIFNEDTLEDLLRRFVTPVVNYALEDQPGSCHYGRGTRCNVGMYKPDWSVVSNLCVDETGHYLNVLPGDTKIDAKWRPTMVGEQENYREWQNVMAQIVTYMALNHSRYGFIITDRVFVALRITRCEVGPGLAAGRPRRATAATVSHQRQPSDESMASAGSSYLDDEPLEWEYHDPEYAVVPWDAHGRGRLTIKLALWCLAMMAANGDNYIDYWYPDLDSWRLGKEGYYVHNTTGATKRRLDRGALLQNPTPKTPGGDRAWGAGQPLAAALEGEIVDSSLGYLELPGPSTGQDVPYFSQAASPFPGWEGEAGHEEDEEHYEHAEENAEEEEEGAEEDEDEHREKGKQRAVAQGVPRGGGADDSNDDDNRTVVGPVVQPMLSPRLLCYVGQLYEYSNARQCLRPPGTISMIPVITIDYRGVQYDENCICRQLL
jgi:hypothetical protein